MWDYSFIFYCRKEYKEILLPPSPTTNIYYTFNIYFKLTYSRNYIQKYNIYDTKYAKWRT